MPKEPCVYILTNNRRTVLYTGVTSDIEQRVTQHREGKEASFTHRYNVDRLVYAAFFGTMAEAIAAEKRIKGGSREKKIRLIEEQNPEWRNLLESSDA